MPKPNNIEFMAYAISGNKRSQGQSERRLWMLLSHARSFVNSSGTKLQGRHIAYWHPIVSVTADKCIE